MRGADVLQESMFTVKTLNDFVPAEHPLRPIREIVNVALKEMDTLFAQMYSEFGRESIAPERLLRALILQALYSIGQGGRASQLHGPRAYGKPQRAGG